MKNLTDRFYGAATFFLLFSFLVFAGSADAQTKKRTKRKTTTSIPQPVSQTTEPVVVSQADQFSNQNQQIITGNFETQEAPQPVEMTTEPESFDQKLDRISSRVKEMNSRMKNLESSKQNQYDERQRRLLLNLDILTRAEQRAESLRKQLFELIEKENTLKTKLETLEYDSRPDVIERQVSFAGSLRPEELREARRKNLDAEKRNLANLLTDIQTTRTGLEQNVQKADLMVEKLRAVLEKDIDDALNEQSQDAAPKKESKDQ